MLRNTLSILLALGLGGCAALDAPEPAKADLLLRDGKIWTGDARRPFASWIAVTGDRITALGDGAAQPPPAARVIDLGGRLVVPGFNDSHVHFAAA
ncbi:MAG: hypothetical protein ACE5HU_02725, partial [Acidobacteriota bacterium]